MSPTELITQIFKSIGSISTADALGSTSRRLHSVWKSHAISICHDILVHSIACYDQAFEYVRAQPIDVASCEQIKDTGSLAIMVAKQFCENAHIACHALRLYETQVIESLRRCRDHDRSRLTEAQRTGFLQAWYRIHTLASLPSDPLPYDMLASLDLLEFEQMMDTFCWLMYWCPNDQRFELRITFQHGCLEGQHSSRKLPKSPISAIHWHNLMTRLSSLNRDLHDAPVGQQCSECRYTYTVQDVYVDIKESGKAVRLADLLPLIGQRDAPDQEYRLSSRDRTQ